MGKNHLSGSSMLSTHSRALSNCFASRQASAVGIRWPISGYKVRILAIGCRFWCLPFLVFAVSAACRLTSAVHHFNICAFKLPESAHVIVSVNLKKTS